MRIFAKRVDEFDPTKFPFVESEGIDYSSNPSLGVDGHAIVFVGDTTDETVVGDRGRLLGIVEVINVLVGGGSILHGDKAKNGRLTGEVLKHISYFPMVKAWEFRPKLKVADAINEHLPFGRQNKLADLQKKDVLTVLALPKAELTLPPLSKFSAIDQQGSNSTNRILTTGPTPGDWLGIVQRTANREAWTYVMRFGLRNIWKIGHTQDLVRRLTEINQHVPYEDLDECWSLALDRRWDSSVDAYFMEQLMLKRLDSCRTAGERVRCREDIVRAAWDNCS